MEPIDPRLWHRFPGYDSDGSDDDAGGNNSHGPAATNRKSIRPGIRTATRAAGGGSGGGGGGSAIGSRSHAGSNGAGSSQPEDWSSRSGSHDSGEPEQQTLHERLRSLVSELGSRYVETPLIDFVPIPATAKDSKETSLAMFRQVAPSRPFSASFRIARCCAPVVTDTLLANGLSPTPHPKDWLVQWSGPGVPDGAYHGLHEHQRINHFPGSTELTRKDRMWINVKRMAQGAGGVAFDFVPETFVLPDQVEEFLECYEQDHKRRKMWIVKPRASSQGKGIFLLRDIRELPLNEHSVVSRYVHNPLLIQGLKFDLRVYVLVTGYDPLRAYIYREGLVRFASMPYSTDDEHLQDAYRHLTNYSINKKASNFVENQELRADNVGHKWSLSALDKHLACLGVDVRLMWVRIMDLIVKTLLCVEPAITSKTREMTVHRQSCFELYGFDVIVDDELKPWLLEVNLSPSMQAESPLDWQIKSALLSEVFNIVGISSVDQNELSAARRRAATQMVSEQQARKNFSTGRARRSRRLDHPILPPPEPPPLVPADVDQRPVVLGTLTESQVRVLARALRERHRCRNFIPLFPTRAAMQRYAPLTRWQVGADGGPLDGSRTSSSYLLASLLFGPKPLHSLWSSNALPPQLPLARSSSTPLMIADRRRSMLSSSSGPLPPRREKASAARRREMHEDTPDETEERDRAAGGPSPRTLCSQALGALKTGSFAFGQSLLLMEYLSRIEAVCAALHEGDDDDELLLDSDLCGLLTTFRQQLVGDKNQGQQPPAAKAPKAVKLLVRDIAAACQFSVKALAHGLRGAAALASAPQGTAGLAGSMTEASFSSPLTRRLPKALVASAECGHAVLALASLDPADLEVLLRQPQNAGDLGLQRPAVAPSDGSSSSSSAPSAPAATATAPSSQPTPRRPSSTGAHGARSAGEELPAVDPAALSVALDASLLTALVQGSPPHAASAGCRNDDAASAILSSPGGDDSDADASPASFASGSSRAADRRRARDGGGMVLSGAGARMIISSRSTGSFGHSSRSHRRTLTNPDAFHFGAGWGSAGEASAGPFGGGSPLRPPHLQTSRKVSRDFRLVQQRSKPVWAEDIEL